MERGLVHARRSRAAAAPRVGAAADFSNGNFPIGADVLRDAHARHAALRSFLLSRRARRRRIATAQPSTLRISLNGLPIYRTILPNHPHDARGALSYLRGGRGAYGYLCHATVEGAPLQELHRADERQSSAHCAATSRAAKRLMPD